MRVIKFRGKTETNFPDNKGNIVIPKDKWIYGGIVYDVDRVWIDMPYYGQILVNKETVGQYTGLKDKNGKEIYEGDIVKIEYADLKFKGAVKYDETYLAYVITHTYTATHEYENLGDYIDYDIEVIGNIYDNPELLKAGD